MIPKVFIKKEVLLKASSHGNFVRKTDCDGNNGAGIGIDGSIVGGGGRGGKMASLRVRRIIAAWMMSRKNLKKNDTLLS